MKRSTLPWVALAVAAPLLASVVPAAAATPAGKAGVHTASRSAHPATSAKGGGAIPSAVSGYQIVNSGTLIDTANSQTLGSATCPRGTKVVGGGGVIGSTGLAENINGSIPTSTRTWGVYVNNAGSGNGTFVVYAVCAKTVPGYSQAVGAGVDDPAGSQVSATVTCPSGKVPLGGGGLGSSLDTQVNLNSSIPLSTGWRVDVNNNSAGTNTATAYAVCATAPPRYSQVSAHAATTIPMGTQGASNARCPGGTVVLGGGGFSSSGSVLVNLNTTLPNNTHVWRSYENNGSGSDNTIRAYAVCGKATAAA